MEQKIYVVAVNYSSETFNPTVVEQFNNEEDANTYASLMSRTKHRKYVVLEQKVEYDGTSPWDGTSQEK